MRLALAAPVLASQVLLDLLQGEPMCVSEALEKDMLFEVHAEAVDPVVNGQEQAIKVQVLDPSGKDVFHETRPKVLTAFSAYAAGEYHACVTAQSRDMRVSLDVRMGAEANSFSNSQQAPTGQEEDKIDRLLHQAKHMLTQYHRDIALAKTRAEKTMAVHNQVATRLIWCTVCTVGFIMAVSVYQVTHIKQYFRGRKLL